MKSYSRKELSELLSVSLAAIYKWEKKGLIKSFKNERGLIRYSQEEVSKFSGGSITKYKIDVLDLDNLSGMVELLGVEVLNLRDKLAELKEEKEKIINKQ
jgi:phage terminase Nu1 subunit (DNA packaging protein)